MVIALHYVTFKVGQDPALVLFGFYFLIILSMFVAPPCITSNIGPESALNLLQFFIVANTTKGGFFLQSNILKNIKLKRCTEK